MEYFALEPFENLLELPQPVTCCNHHILYFYLTVIATTFLHMLTLWITFKISSFVIVEPFIMLSNIVYLFQFLIVYVPYETMQPCKKTPQELIQTLDN